ncbi:MAG: SRPBCC family protein [Candidatus Lokiarchaeota archaeon]|nr:SRPBCC family protein [Candidatus Lokiarchaeota archaeon]
MVKFTNSIIINKSLETVWKAYIDPQNMLCWTNNLEKVEVIKGKFGEVGAIAHLHYIEKGRLYILEDKLLDYEFEKKIKSQVKGQGMNIEVQSNFKSQYNDTEISITWDGTSEKFIVKIILNLLQRKIKKQAQAELSLFKKLVETYGINFPEKTTKKQNEE